MRREAKKLLYDIHQAGVWLGEYTAGKTFEDYLKERLLRAGVEREFMTIGEALRQLLQEAPEIEKRITDPRGIIGFRNKLAHGYSEIEDDTVWEILIRRLPRLLEEVDALLAEE